MIDLQLLFLETIHYMLLNQWRIQGAPPPQTGPNSFVFAHVSAKSIHVGGRRPPPPKPGNPGSAAVNHSNVWLMPYITVNLN